jgi:hypothetical protein
MIASNTAMILIATRCNKRQFEDLTMHTVWYAALPIALVVTGASAAAQNAGEVGVVFQVPVALGVIWHASEGFALRPEVSYSTATGTGLTQKTWSLAVNTPYYLSSRNHVQTYLSPRVGYSRTTNSTPGSPGVLPTSTNWSGAGSFGVQYSPTPALSIYGENGISYSSITSSSNSHFWGPRSALGLILYLGK